MSKDELLDPNTVMAIPNDPMTQPGTLELSLDETKWKEQHPKVNKEDHPSIWYYRYNKIITLEARFHSLTRKVPLNAISFTKTQVHAYSCSIDGTSNEDDAVLVNTIIVQPSTLEFVLEDDEDGLRREYLQIPRFESNLQGCGTDGNTCETTLGLAVCIMTHLNSKKLNGYSPLLIYGAEWSL